MYSNSKYEFCICREQFKIQYGDLFYYFNFSFDGLKWSFIVYEKDACDQTRKFSALRTHLYKLLINIKQIECFLY